MAERPFEIICEIEPATSPDLRRVRHQIGVLSGVSSTFLIPDNHIGRATVSSIAVAHEVIDMGGRAIACLNARDRNTLGFPARPAYSCCVRGRRVLVRLRRQAGVGRKSDDLTVRRMLAEARRFEHQHTRGASRFRLGVASALRPLPPWKLEADFLFAQVGFSLDQIMEWRASVEFEGPVYAGVMVVGSAQMAVKLSGQFPQLTVPGWLTERFETDKEAGVEFACDLVCQLRESGAFDGHASSLCAGTARLLAGWRLSFSSQGHIMFHT